jgi:glycosyltransferase involved in cell wall biosynthesis
VKVERSYSPEWLWSLYYGTNAAGTPTLWSKLLGRIEAESLRYCPIDPKIWFTPFAAVRALSLAKSTNAVALVTAAPYSSFLVGLVLGAANVPWIADFRDPWSFNFEMQKKAPLVRWVEAQVERWVLSSATKVIFASDATRKRYEELFPWLVGKTKTLYSGFEREPETRTSTGSVLAGQKTLIHFGTFYGPRRLGVFVDAVAGVVREKNLTPGALQILLLGSASQADLLKAQSLGVGEFFTVKQALPYEEGIRVLRCADALLYCDPGRERYFVAGKLFDYLRAERPIFALSASEEIAEILTSHKLGKVCDPDDLDSMVAALASFLEDPERGLNYAPHQLEDLTAEASARALGAIFLSVGSAAMG